MPSGAVASWLIGMPRAPPALPSSAYLSSIGVAAAAASTEATNAKSASAAPKAAVRRLVCACIRCSPITGPATRKAPRSRRRRPNMPSLTGRRNDWQEKVRLLVAAGMDRVGAGIVVGMIVRVVHAADAVARLDIEPDAVALPEHHRGRPNLDLDPHDLARRQQQAALVPMIGAIGQRKIRIELAMGHPQPTLGHRHLLALLTHLPNIVAVGIDVADGEEQIHVFGAARYKQHRRYRPGHLGVLTQRRRLQRDSHAGLHGARRQLGR